jgi:thiopeptide-type bacteriocin biosynthesis protein
MTALHPDQRCLYTLVHAPRERNEEILRDFVTPLAGEVRGCPELDSLFFARFNVPSWQLRFRILGRPDWIEGDVRRLVEERLAPLQEAGWIERVEYAVYDREVERYGGPEGMVLAEKIFLHDSLACLDLMEAERRGELLKTRREFSLLMTERMLDLLGFDRARRMAFYEFGHHWEEWDAEERQLLEERYQDLRPGLLDLLAGEQKDDPEILWGGEVPARIAAECLAATRPLTETLLEAHAAGRIPQNLLYLAWSYTHMECNRLGIDPRPEAILRFFLHRLYQDEESLPLSR